MAFATLSSPTLEPVSDEVKRYQRLKLTAAVTATIVELAFLGSMAFAWGPSLGDSLAIWLGSRGWLLHQGLDRQWVMLRLDERSLGHARLEVRAEVGHLHWHVLVGDGRRPECGLPRPRQYRHHGRRPLPVLSRSSITPAAAEVAGLVPAACLGREALGIANDPLGG